MPVVRGKSLTIYNRGNAQKLAPSSLNWRSSVKAALRNSVTSDRVVQEHRLCMSQGLRCLAVVCRICAGVHNRCGVACGVDCIWKQVLESINSARICLTVRSANEHDKSDYVFLIVLGQMCIYTSAELSIFTFVFQNLYPYLIFSNLGEYIFGAQKQCSNLFGIQECKRI